MEISNFYDKYIKDVYNITEEQCKDICSSPFRMLKEVISSGSMVDVRLQYFGLFKVNSGRVKYSLKNLEKKYQEERISKEKYIERKNILTKYKKV